MIENEEKTALVPLGEKSQHQNPLRMLELILKGFCPTVIRDRVEINIHEEMNTHHDATESRRSCEAKDASQVPILREQNTDQVPTRSRCAKRSRPKTTTMSFLAEDNHEKPFEIGERPPSGVIGISKKIWEGFCYNPYDNGESVNHAAKRQQLPHKGFCSILMDQVCFDDNDNDPLPDGEECSVDTSMSSTVDLSPQSSPRLASSSFLSVDEDDDRNELEEEENLPIVEFQENRSYRGTQVLIMTIVALYATFVLVQSLEHVHHKRPLLSVESRHNVPFERSLFAVSRR